MSNETKNPNQSNQSFAELQQGYVRIAIGAGNAPVDVEWEPGDTVSTVIERAKVSLSKDQTATIGKRRVKKPEKTKVYPGDLIVVAGKPANG